MIFQNPQLLVLLLLLPPAAYIIRSGTHKTARLLNHFSGDTGVSPRHALAIQLLSLLVLGSLLLVAPASSVICPGPMRAVPASLCFCWMSRAVWRRVPVVMRRCIWTVPAAC